MNLMVQPGTSSDPRVLAYGPNLTGWMLQSFWRAYYQGGDQAYSQPKFERLVRAGNIICLTLVAGDETVLAQFGIQLLKNRNGWPYTQFIFFYSDLHVLDFKEDLPLVVQACWRVAKLYKTAENFDGEMKMRLVGRTGWRRIVRRLGLKMDRHGWITEDQEAFNNGREWRY